MSISRRCFLVLCALMSWGGLRPARASDSHAEWELDRFYIAGFRFHQGPGVIARMRRGDLLALYAEPENPYDAGAVRLEFAGKHVGYVPRSRNAVPGRLLSQGAPVLGRIVAVDPAAEPSGWIHAA